MFHFGMPTMLELDGLEANVHLCQAMGLEFVEINMNMPEYQVEALDPEVLKHLSATYGIYFTFHMADNLDIANFQKEVRDVNVDLVRRTLAFAQKVNSPSVNMHMQKGVLFTLPSGKVYIYDKYLERYMAYVEAFGQEMDGLLEGSDLKLLVENTGDFNLEFIRRSSQKLIDYDHIGMTYDIGHDFSSFGNDREFILDNLAKITHMHIHDAEGEKDHLVLGDGKMQLDRYIGFAKNFEIRCVIETKTVEALRKSVELLPRYLKEFDNNQARKVINNE